MADDDKQLEDDLEEQLKRLKVSDILVQTILSVGSLGFAKLDGDLEQAKLAIESLRVLIPVLEGGVPTELTRDFNQMLASLQLGYAKAAAAGSGAEGSK